nr:hypothetical protein [Tanacetum cinerariifolium]
MINLIKNGDQPLPRVTQVSIAGTTSTEQPPLKDKSMCNKTAKDLWDALARHMLGLDYGKQDRKAAVLYEYETFKATKGELLLDTYIRYLQVINALKKYGYSKDNCELNFKFLNNLQPEWKQSKEKVVVYSDSEGSVADDFSELKKIIILLAKAFNRRKFYSKPTNNNLRTSSSSQSANKKQEFVKSDDKKVEKKADEKKQDMSKVSYYLSESESESEFETSEYYDNSTNYGLFMNNDDDQEIFHDAIESASENFIENHSYSQNDYDKSDVDHNDSEEKDHLVDKLIRKFNHKIEKIIINLEDEVVNLLEKEKANMETIESLKSKSFESSEKVSSESKNKVKMIVLLWKKSVTNKRIQ